MLLTSFKTLADSSQAEFKDKGSRFIAFAFPILNEDDIKKHIDTLRQEHHKARHWCYAYRLGVDGNYFRANDDGEPAGSAGRPILGQIDSFSVTDVLVVVVRYFGGTLLGVPGLIKAYKNATLLALQQASIVEKNIEYNISVQCEYAYLNDVRRIANQHQGVIIKQELGLNCHLTVRVPLANYQACINAWRQMRVIEVLENNKRD